MRELRLTLLLLLTLSSALIYFHPIIGAILVGLSVILYATSYFIEYIKGTQQQIIALKDEVEKVALTEKDHFDKFFKDINSLKLALKNRLDETDD